MPRKFITGALLLLTATAAFSFYWVFQVDNSLCTGCTNCIPWCPENAISMVGPDAWIDPELCTACGDCVYHCPWGAIQKVWYTGIEGTETAQRPVISPNPSPEAVSVSGLSDGQSVSVFDATGRLILSGQSTGSSLQMNLPGSGSGLHILVVDGIPVLPFTVIR